MPYRGSDRAADVTLAHPFPARALVLLAGCALALLASFATKLSTVDVRCRGLPEGESRCTVDEWRFGIHSSRTFVVATVRRMRADRRLFGRVILDTAGREVAASGRHPWLGDRFGAEWNSAGCLMRDGRGATTTPERFPSSAPGAALLALVALGYARRRAFVRVADDQLVIGYRTFAVEHVVRRWAARDVRDVRIAPSERGAVNVVVTTVEGSQDAVAIEAAPSDTARAVRQAREALLLDA